MAVTTEERLYKLKLRMGELGTGLVCSNHMFGIDTSLAGQIAPAVIVVGGASLCAECLMARVEPVLARESQVKG